MTQLLDMSNYLLYYLLIMKNTNISKQYNKFANLFEKEANIKDGNQISKNDFYNFINEDLRNKKLLDIGCGDGTDLLYFKNKGAEVFGVDNSEGLLDIAGTKINKENIKIGSFGTVPFKDGLFDIVTSKYALQTTDDVKPFFNESYRVLKNKGFLVFLVVHPFRQYMEKGKAFKNYFEQKIVNSNLFNNTITVQEPTHTMQDYLSKDFFKLFELIDFKEDYDFPASECVDGNIYPTYFIIKARKK